MTTKLFYLAAFIAFLFFVSCTSGNKTETVSNEKLMSLNDIWAVKKINGEDLTKFSFDRGGPLLEIHIKEGKVYGNSGTNEFSGTLEIKDSYIKINDISGTKINPPDQFEMLYYINLKDADNWEKVNMTLYLKKGDKVLLEFKKID